MTKDIIKRIRENTNLIAFCNKIICYNDIFNDEVARSMFFVSLISADTLIDKHSCEETIEVTSFILNNIELFILEDDIKKSVIKYSKDALKIAKQDIKNFE